MTKPQTKSGELVGCINGVFDPIHLGHKRTLIGALAFADMLYIGVKDDAMCAKFKDRDYAPWEDRVDNLRAVVQELNAGMNTHFSIYKQVDLWGYMDQQFINCMFISEEEEWMPDLANRERKKNYPKVEFDLVPFVAPVILDCVGRRLCSTHVATGQVDTNGYLLHDFEYWDDDKWPAEKRRLDRMFDR